MELIDEEGNLLGAVNVVDALVVLFVAAVVVAGAAFVLADDPAPEPDVETRHATLDLGPQPDYVAAAINEGDTHNAGGDSRLTVTDVHLTPAGDRQQVTVRVALRGVVDGGFRYDGAPPRLGRSLAIRTELYRVQGRIRAVESGGEGEAGAGDALDRAPTTVVVRDTLDAADARAVTAGDEVRLSGRTVATVEDVAVHPTDDPGRRLVRVEAELDALRRGGERRFGGGPVRRGGPVRLPTDDYAIDGRIDRVDGGLDRATTDVLLRDTVDVETAERIAPGDAAVVAGRTVATVEEVAVYGTADPDRKRAFVGLSLATVDAGDGERPRFGDTPVRRGAEIEFGTAGYDLVGTVERVGATTQRGSPATRTVTLQMRNVREPMAGAVDPGMTERAGGRTVARVRNVTAQPSVVVLTGEDGSLGVFEHPVERDVTITAALRVRETTAGVRFKGETIRQGATVTLDLGTVTVRATVVDVGPRTGDADADAG